MGTRPITSATIADLIKKKMQLSRIIFHSVFNLFQNTRKYI